MRAIAASAAWARVGAHRRMRGRVLRAFNQSREYLIAGGVSIFRPLWAGVLVVFGLGVVVWESGRACVSVCLPNSRKRATAHGLRVSVCLRLRLPSVSVSAVFVRPSNLIFLALIILRLWWGVFYSQTATEKRRTVCVRSSTLPRSFLRTPNTSHSVGGFGNLPNSGGEFRNRNHGVFL